MGKPTQKEARRRCTRKTECRRARERLQGTGALCRMDMAGAGDMENMECVGSKAEMK